MCGIVARIGHEGIAHAMDLMAHRGVRRRIEALRWGVYGHTRLPIVGVSTEYDQPIHRGFWTIGFVGQVLDFRDHNPNAISDLDTVVDSWVNTGPAGLVGRDGFWAVVAMNNRDSSIHVVCDYLAQKPMYYRPDVCAVASEPDSVACLAPVTPDEVYLSAVVKWGYCPDAVRTPYCEIKRVLPGEHVRLRPGGNVFREIVDPIVPRPTSMGDLRREIETAVVRRVLASDVPIACLLSGGLDSSIVYALAKQYGKVRPYYVSNEVDNEERLRVSVVADGAEVVDCDWHEVSIRRALGAMQEPIDLGSLLPQLALSDAVQEAVCLTGDGADELFGGYGRARRYDSQASDIFHELVCWHLPRLDRVMMRNTIETRSPFLARRVVEGAMALARPLRTNKEVLRDMFQDLLPKEIIRQKKIPLRVLDVENDREGCSQILVDHFRRDKWPER